MSLSPKSKYQSDHKILNIPFVSEYKYLGVQLNRHMNLTAHLKIINQKNMITLGRIRNGITAASCQVKLLLIQSLLLHHHHHYVGPICRVLKHTQVELLIQNWRRTIRMALGLGRTTPNRIIDAILSPPRSQWLAIDDQASPVSKAKNLNMNIIAAINILNRGKCKEHSARMTTEHLREHHGVELTTDMIIAAIDNRCDLRGIV